MAVLELPPSESFRSQVKIWNYIMLVLPSLIVGVESPTESRYGTTSLFFLAPFTGASSASAAITRPNVVSDLLMFDPSLNRAPVAPVEFALSEPARSTSLPSSVSHPSFGGLGMKHTEFSQLFPSFHLSPYRGGFVLKLE